MFASNPFFIGTSDVVLTRAALSADVHSDLREPLALLLRALQLVTTLRTLQNPSDGSTIHEAAAKTLEAEVARLLRSAAGMLHPPMAELLLGRSDAFLSANFEPAARQYASLNKLPFEFVIGALPSWRFTGHPRLYTGLLAIPRPESESISETIELLADNFMAAFCEHEGIPPITRSAAPPLFVVADLLGIGGDAMSHPIHIGNFFPNDEGIFKNAGRGRSVLYSNLYTLRFQRVSTSLALRAAGADLVTYLPVDRHAETHLIAWFRGHDLGHLYFDPICKTLQGMPRFQRYVLQETMADLFGFLLADHVFQRSERSCPEQRHASATFVAEMLRYSTRDATLFPDAAAAWLQILFAMEVGAARIKPDAFDIRIDDVPAVLRDLFRILLGYLRGGETALLQAVLSDADASRLDASRGGAVRSLLHPSVVYTDVDPIFADADSVLDSYAAAPELATVSRAAAIGFGSGRPTCYCRL